MPPRPSVVFMGTPEFAVPSLEALLRAGFPVKGVFCQPDRPVGRGGQVTPPPVKRLAVEHGIPVYQPLKLRGDAEALATLQALAPEAIAVVAYGQILPESVLSIPPLGCINVHGSLLPRYRGAAPIQWAVLNGDAETGVTTMFMEKGLDTGPMLLEAQTPIAPDETSETLAKRLAPIGADLLVTTLERLALGTIAPRPQDDREATYASMLRKDMAPLDWTMGARALSNRVRGLAPWPGTTASLGGETIKVLKARAETGPVAAAPGTFLEVGPAGWRIATGEGILLVEEVQFPGRKPQPAEVAGRGWRRLEPGVRFDPLPSP